MQQSPLVVDPVVRGDHSCVVHLEWRSVTWLHGHVHVDSFNEHVLILMSKLSQSGDITPLSLFNEGRQLLCYRLVLSLAHRYYAMAHVIDFVRVPIHHNFDHMQAPGGDGINPLSLPYITGSDVIVRCLVHIFSCASCPLLWWSILRYPFPINLVLHNFLWEFCGHKLLELHWSK